MTNANKEYAGQYEVHRVGDDRLYFEHVEYGEDRACCVELDDDGKIYDYDMCYTIPKPVGQWLFDNGYNVEYYQGESTGYWEYTPY